MNVRLLRKVKNHILEEPRRFIMRTWLLTREYVGGPSYPSDNGAKEVKFAKCGTAACIAGWAVLLHDKRITNYDEIARRASELLELDEMKSYRLFGATWWPEPFGSQYRKAKTPTARAKIAAARIEHYIKTEGAE